MESFLTEGVNYVTFCFPDYHHATRIMHLYLRDIRKIRGLTQEQLGKKAGLSKNAVYAYEHGYYCPTLIAALDLCRALDCKIDDLIEYQDCIVE